MTAPQVTAPPFLSRSRLAATVLALAAVFAGPGVGSALALNELSITNDPVVCENDSGTANAVFNVHRANPSGSVGVTAGTQAVTATADTDYTVTNTTFLFSGTEADMSFNVPIIGDNTDGGNDTAPTETFNANLAGPTGGATAEPDPAAVGTIVDDDPDPTVTVDDASANEGSFAVFPLHLSFAQPSPCTATVLFSTFGGNDATSYSNFPVIFASGATTASSPSVAHFCDSFGEGTEAYSASVTAATNQNAAGTDGATGTIFDGCFSGFPSGNADLYLQKVESADPVAVGTEFRYILGVYNFGPAVAQNVTISDPLPAGVQFVSASPTQGTCSGTTTVTCNLLSVNPGATPYVEIRVKPTVEAVLQNTATVTSSNFDPFTGNNSATTLTQAGGTAAIPNPGGATIAALRGSRVCDWSGGQCVVIVDCINLEQDCTAVGQGRVLTSGGTANGARAFRFRRLRRSVAAGEEEELFFRVGFDARRAIRRALRRGHRVRAKVKVTVTDSAGHRTVRRRTLRLVR